VRLITASVGPKINITIVLGIAIPVAVFWGAWLIWSVYQFNHHRKTIELRMAVGIVSGPISVETTETQRHELQDESVHRREPREENFSGRREAGSSPPAASELPGVPIPAELDITPHARVNPMPLSSTRSIDEHNPRHVRPGIVSKS
jgi:hypothetical protein